MYNYSSNTFAQELYENNSHIDFRWGFIKRFSNRKYSIRDYIFNFVLHSEIIWSKILDIGAGSWSFLKKFLNLFPENKFFAIDIVLNQKLEEEKRILSDKYDGYNFPYNFPFDYIFCMHTLYHVERLEIFLNSVKKLLHANSTFIITTKSKYTLPKIDLIFVKIAVKFNIKFKKYKDEAHFCFENGMSVLEITFPSESYKIKVEKVVNQLWIDDFDQLLDYILSTPRYNPKNLLLSEEECKEYIECWKKETNDAATCGVFIDEVIESIFIISCIK